MSHACNRDGELLRSVCLECHGAYACCTKCDRALCECEMPRVIVDDCPLVGINEGQINMVTTIDGRDYQINLTPDEADYVATSLLDMIKEVTR